MDLQQWRAQLYLLFLERSQYQSGSVYALLRRKIFAWSFLEIESHQQLPFKDLGSTT